MGVLVLNLFEHPSGAVFDPGKVIEEVRAWFPQTKLLPEDQLVLRAEQAEAFFADELRSNPDSKARIVIETLRRNAQIYGPAYAFEIPIGPRQIVRGTARRYDLTFLSDEPVPEGVRQRLIEFLKSFGVGSLESSMNENRKYEVLCDMPGTPGSANGFPDSSAVSVPDAGKLEAP